MRYAYAVSPVLNAMDGHCILHRHLILQDGSRQSVALLRLPCGSPGKCYQMRRPEFMSRSRSGLERLCVA